MRVLAHLENIYILFIIYSLLFIGTCLPISSLAQEKENEHEQKSDLNSMSLDELMNLKIEGSTREQKVIQEAPSIVTVVTAEEIKDSGARDLIDVINLVPGLQLASDVEGTVSVAVRGLWAHEGKILLLIDGEEMNEIAYSTIQLGNHYPVDSIDRVEVIRGPGSALYGGYAELAVINVITKGASQLNGVVVNGMYGQMGSTYAQRDLGLGFGKELGSWKISSYAFIGQGTRSDQNYTDSNGSTYNFAGNSNLNPAFVNLGASDDHWSFRLIYDRYDTTDQSAYGVNAPIPEDTFFETFIFSTKYNAKLSETLSLLPEFHYKENEPWIVTDPSSLAISQLYSNVRDQEIRGTLSLRAQLAPELITYFGIEGRVQEETDFVPGSVFPNGQNQISYYRNAAFTEVDWNPSFAAFTLGGRYESQNVGGAAIVPRISAVKQLGDFHTKLLYSWGFREPGIENLRYNPNLVAETTKVAEAEFGYRFSQTMLANINIYDISMLNPIIYGYSANAQSYQNSTSAGTYGLEAGYKIKSNWGYVDLNYSYFHTVANEPIDYQVPDHPDSMLGLANHKIVANAHAKLTNNTHINLTETFLSSRYGYDYDPTSPTGLSIRNFSPAYLTNLFLENSNTVVKNLYLAVGVFNLFNQDFRYIQPYDGGHPPLPGSSRDWLVKASYKVEL